MKREIPRLSLINWQVFATLTLKDERVSDDWAVKRWFALGRTIAEWFNVHFLDLLWCLRLEYGEATNRKHFHALIGGLPDDTIHRHTMFAIKNVAETLGWGMARCYVFNPTLPGVDYMLKELGGIDWMHSNGANLYEFAKFDPSRLMLSMSILRVLQHREHKGETVREALCKRQ